jgi:hypothetical protein
MPLNKLKKKTTKKKQGVEFVFIMFDFSVIFFNVSSESAFVPMV